MPCRSIVSTVACSVVVSWLSVPVRGEVVPARATVRAVSAPLVVHEWGTFTSLQDEQGNAIGGINGDDEPVPEFVHRIASLLILSPTATIPIFYQGAPACHPDVTMRLETPVVYFHPGEHADLPLTLDIDVSFPAGWLSEYYPDAAVEAPGVTKQQQFGRIRSDTVGRLRWQQLLVGTDAPGPKTSSAVWLAPRAVQAAGVTTSGGESERFLFYRGVGHVDSPVRVERDSASGALNLTATFPAMDNSSESKNTVTRMWLVDVSDKDSCAFRELPGFEVRSDGATHPVGATAAQFDESEFESSNLAKVCAEMQAALVEEGLFADEADALLNTWKLSYFQSPGMRLFYMLPRSWTDGALPLRTSVDAKIVRAMVGRVEIVTPSQRKLLSQIAAGPASKPQRDFRSPQQAADFRVYEQLGRFRNALLLNELKRRPTPELQNFVDNYGLCGYRLDR